MICITIFQNSKKEYTGFKVTGHAGYAESGYDIVCASVSILVTNTLNAIETYTIDDFTFESKEESGYMLCMFSTQLSEQAVLLCNTMILGLKSIQATEPYQEYMNIIFEEV
jgi:Predicted ribosomal protein